MAFIIALGGAKGVGKSIIAERLANDFFDGTACVISIGRVLTALRKSKLPALPSVAYERVMHAPSLDETVRVLRAQSEIIKPFTLLAAATLEHVPLVVLNGTYALPGLYTLGTEVDAYATVYNLENSLDARIVRDPKERGKTPVLLERNHALQNYIMDETKKHQCQGLPSGGDDYFISWYAAGAIARLRETAKRPPLNSAAYRAQIQTHYSCCDRELDDIITFAKELGAAESWTYNLLKQLEPDDEPAL